MTNYLTLRVNAIRARSKFGVMLRDWYYHNGWELWTLASWGKSASFQTIPYGLMTDIFNGTAGELQRDHFEALGEANRRLTVLEYGSFANSKTAKAVQGAVGLLHDNCLPWNASDFWACYCGLLSPVRPLKRHED